MPRNLIASIVAVVLVVGSAWATREPASAEEPVAPQSLSAEALLPFSPRRARFLFRGPDGETREVRWLRLPAPAGAFRAVRVDLERSVDVLVADARVTIELGFVPGRGEVLERTLQRVSFLGFGGTRERRSLELLAEGDPIGGD
jgi:hypothetical protein